jgi:hypothetical protein
MMGDYYAGMGIQLPPTCASIEVEEPATTANGDPFVFLCQLRQKVAIERLPTGFDGHIFLVVQGKTIIKHRGGVNFPRVYVSWRGGLDFSLHSTFERTVVPRIEPEKISRYDDTGEVSHEVSMDFTPQSPTFLKDRVLQVVI